MTTKISCGGFDIDNDTLIEEDGVLKVKGGSSGGGVLVVNASADEAGTTITLDKTWQEIQDAPFTIVKAALSGTTFFYYVSDIEQSESGYYILCEVLNEPNASMQLYTDSPAGYPIYHRG